MGNNIEEKNFNFNQKPYLKNLNNYYKENNGIAKIIIITELNEITEKEFERLKNTILNQSFIYWEWYIINKSNINDEKIKVDNKIFIEDELTKILINTNQEIICIVNENDLLEDTALETIYWTMNFNSKIMWGTSNIVSLKDRKLIKNKFNTKTEDSTFYLSTFFIKRNILNINENVIKLLTTPNEFLYEMINNKELPIILNYYMIWKNDEIEKYRCSFKSKKFKNFYIGNNYPTTSSYYYNYSKNSNWELKYDNKDNKETIIFLLPWMVIGGADKFNLDIISKMNKEKYNVVIISTEDSEYVWRQRFSEYAEIFDLTTFLHREYWATFIDYLIKSRNAKIVFQSNSFYGYYALPWLKSQNSEVSFVDYLHASNYEWRNGEYPRDSTAISKILDKTLVASEFVKLDMLRNMNRKDENIEIVYLGVDEKYFDSDKIDLNSYNINDLNRIEDNTNIVFCSRLSKEKRPMLAIRILEELLKNGIVCNLLFVGNGPLELELKEYVNQNNLKNNVIFFGPHKDVRPFYKVANLCLITSIREGITLTTYEALAMQIPVVSADVGGQSELITEDVGVLVKNTQNETTYLLKEYSDYEITNYYNAVLKVLDMNSKEVKINIRKKILDKFRIEIMINKIENIFDLLISEGSKVKKEYYENENLYNQYLLLYNELDRRYYNNSDTQIIEISKNEKYDILKEDNLELLYNYINVQRENLKQNEVIIKEIKLENKKSFITINNIYNSKKWKFLNKVDRILGRNKKQE